VRRLAFTDGNLSEAAATLLGGGVVVLPTDTVYGIACRPDCPDALERIRAMKRRDAQKPFQLLVDSSETAWALGASRTPQSEVLARLWPGALTLVLPVPGGTEGFRVPAMPRLRALLRACGGALRCTSANLSGEPPAIEADAAQTLAAQADLLLDGGPSPVGQASTVAALDAQGRLTILRQGVCRLPALPGRDLV